MNIACVQTAAVWEDKAATHRHVAALLDAAAGDHGPQQAEGPRGLSKASLVILPEMFATGFSMNVAAIAEAGNGGGGPTHQFLAQQAQARGIYILGGVVTHGSQGKGRNQAVLFGPDGKELLRYQKVHPFSFGAETAHYDTGTEIATVDIGGFRLCPLICYDLRFPELFRTAALQRGVDLFVVIAAWPRPRDAHWKTLLAARAIENQAYVAAVNHCGADPTLSYFGASRILDPKGVVLAEAGADPAVIQHEIDPAIVQQWRREFPALRDAHAPTQ